MWFALPLKGPFPTLMQRGSFVFVLNHRFCLNSASDWSVILTLSRLKIPYVFSPMNLELIKIIMFKTAIYVLNRYGIR